MIDPESFRAQADAWHETLAMHAPHASRLLLAEQGAARPAPICATTRI
ncbi:MAG: hypothetical protein R3E96_10240 [Planctomycetota bacterium]